MIDGLYDLQNLILGHHDQPPMPEIAMLFRSSPFMKTVKGKVVVKPFQDFGVPNEIVTASQREIDVMMHGGLIDDTVIEISITSEMYSPHRGGDTSTNSDMSSLSLFLVNGGRLVPIPSGTTTRRALSRRGNSTHIVQVTVREDKHVKLEDADQTARRICVANRRIPESMRRSSGRSRRATGNHRPVAAAG